MSAVHGPNNPFPPRARYGTLLNSVYAPFLWLILSPLITVPLSAVLYRYHVFAPGHDGCTEWFEKHDGFTDESPDSLPFFPFYDCGDQPLDAIILAFTVPGLLNLVPFLWAVLSPLPITRLAGIVAGTLGILRLALPAILLELNNVDTYDGAFLRGAPAIYLIGALAWLGCLLIWGAFASLVESGVLETSSEREKLPDLPPAPPRANQEQEDLPTYELEAPDYASNQLTRS